MMPRLKLVYFPGRAKAEMVRMACAFGKIPFEDMTPTEHFGMAWQEGAKAETPYGGLPILLVNDTVLSQSGSIMRYIAGLAKLVPDDPFEAARCDSVFEASQELATSGSPGNVNPIVNVFKGDMFAQKRSEYLAAFPAKLANLSRQLGSGPFFMGAKPYYCDLALYHVLSNTQLLDAGALNVHASPRARTHAA
jgi:glutathione S-transferase